MSAYLWSLRMPIPPYRGEPLPMEQRCPLMGRGCMSLCRYDLSLHHGVIDGRCLTKMEAQR